MDPRQRQVRAAWMLSAVVFLLATVAFPLRTERLNPTDRAEVFQAPDGNPQKWTGETLRNTLKVLEPDLLRPEPNLLRLYAWSEVTLDVLFPLAYVALFLLLPPLIWSGPTHRWYRLGWNLLRWGLPLATGLLDLIENVTLFGAATAPSGASLDKAAAVLTVVGPLKIKLFWACLGLLVAAILGSRRLGRFFALIWLGRAPVLGLSVLLLLAALGGSAQLSPTIPNMMLLSGFWQTALVAVLAGVLAVSAGFALILVWEHGGERTGVELPNMPSWIAKHPAGSARRGGPFLIFALPLVCQALARSAWAGGVAAWKLLPGALLGLGIAFLSIRMVDQLGDRLENRLGARRAGKVLGRILRWIGPKGYVSPRELNLQEGDSRKDALEEVRLYPGHLKSTAALGLGALAYVICHLTLRPSIERADVALVPTLAYLLGLTSVVVTLLAGLAFLFDRWRVPLVLVVLLWAVFLGRVSPVKHEFEAQWNPELLPTVSDAARARLKKQQATEKILTVVTATGGGIQAAAWTAQVLAGLDEELDGRFTRTMALFSSTSGGSVGGYFVLSGFGSGGGLEAQKRQAVKDASQASSLEETAWGLVFPDFQRAVRPLVKATKDRGWAMERGWMRARHSELHTSKDDLEKERLSHWADRARTGELPAVIFNSTRIDDGGPLRLSTVGSSCAGGCSPEGLVAERSYTCVDKEGMPVAGFLDVGTATAARLSATFPFVSPITQPEEHKSCSELKRWHAADGGYFDNHGTTGALAWLADLTKECADCLKSASKVIWLQIDTFPKAPELKKPNGGGWVMSVAGPVLGIVRVRTGSQRFRREQQMAWLKQQLGEQLEVVTLAPPNPPPGTVVRDPPLSWFLSNRDKKRISDDWEELKKGEDVSRLRRLFSTMGASPAAAVSPPSPSAAGEGR